MARKRPSSILLLLEMMAVGGAACVSNSQAVLVTAFQLQVSQPEVLIIHGNVCFLHSFSESFEPFGMRRQEQIAGDESDVPVSQLDEMNCGLIAGVQIICSYRAVLSKFRDTVKKHDRKSASEQPVVSCGVVGASEQNAVHPTSREHVQMPLFLFGIFV